MTGRDVLVLCYHAVSEAWPSEAAMAPDRMERQLTTLLERGYRGTTFHAAVTAPPAARTLAVTFDDAYLSTFELAFPVLERLGIPGTLFVPTDFVDDGRALAWELNDAWIGTPHEPELRPMSWAQVGALAEAGWEIGSHTRSHARLEPLGERELEAELAGSRARCEEVLGRPCRSFAYPYGGRDDRVREAVRAAGYEAAAGIPERLHRPDRFDWPRIGAGRNVSDRRFRQLVSPRVRRLRASPLGSAAERAYVTLRGLRPGRSQG